MKSMNGLRLQPWRFCLIVWIGCTPKSTRMRSFRLPRLESLHQLGVYLENRKLNLKYTVLVFTIKCSTNPAKCADIRNGGGRIKQLSDSHSMNLLPSLLHGLENVKKTSCYQIKTLVLDLGSH